MAEDAHHEAAIKGLDPGFKMEVIEAGGEGISACYQCGTCSGGCPSVQDMDYTPRQIIRMVNFGMRDKVLSAKTPFICASCYQCQMRCPRDVKITEIMAAIKSLAIKYNYASKSTRGPAFYTSFNEIVYNLGRQFEPMLMLKATFKSRDNFGDKIKNLIRSAPMGIEFMKRGKLPLAPHKVKGIQEVQRIYENVKRMEAGK